MNNTDAVKVIEAALNAATLKGVYSLSDTNQIVTALRTIDNIVNSTETVSVVTEND
jgi:hypothetical protein